MKTELLILGGGPGGYVAAIRAARLKIKTVLVEKHKIGGVCLNYGCIPTKVLLGKTALLKSIRKGKRFGLKADNVHLDYKKLSAFKNQVVGGLVKGIESTLLSSGVTIVNDEGNFRNPHEIELSSGKLIEFDHAIAASGSRNRDLDTIKCDGDIIIDSTGALALEEIPASMLVIGAGAIGLELGLIFSRLGC
ncbi:MAG: FAD-dependent oxidoreductase, partial [FCB group bacterium]|nr:FAD-dependent oxidoreductase [FCB group bacterium]